MTTQEKVQSIYDCLDLSGATEMEAQLDEIMQDLDCDEEENEEETDDEDEESTSEE